MKSSRIAIVGATLLLAAVAGTATAGETSRRLGCRVDAIAHLLGNQPPPAAQSCG